MAGGTWTSQNKVRPGVYIRFKSANASGLTVGERGTVAIPEPLSWGPVGQVMEIEAGANMVPFTGYDITDPHNRFLNEIFKGSNRTSAPVKVLLYRPAATDAAQASATIGDLTATANYPGARGNDITVVVTEETSGGFTVSTLVDGDVVDQQMGISQVSELTNNDWVTWSGSDKVTANTGAALTGGSDGTVNAAAYSSALTALEAYQFDILVYDGSDTTVMDAYVAFVKRIADESGTYTQLVASGFSSNPDSRFVINVNMGVTMGDGTVLTPSQTVWWVAGASAGARYNESLTYASYPGAVSVSPKLTNIQYETALKSGQFVLFEDDGVVKVEQDINTLVTFTADIGKAFRKNRVIRLCSTIANDLFRQFSRDFVGVVNNNDLGRSRFKAAIVGYLLDIQANEGIQNFTPDDVQVLPGNDIDSVVITISIQPVDSVEKIYMTIEIS